MNGLITIVIVNYNSSDFVINTLYCLEKLTKNSYKVIIRDNNSNLKDFLNLKKNIRTLSNVQLYRVENFQFKGSMAHGIALNDLIKRIDSKYGAILDADATFLYKHWDEILIKELNPMYPIIGTQEYHKPSEKPKKYPETYAIFFNGEIIKNLNIDFRPINVKRGMDTNYLLGEIIYEEGYKAKIIPMRNTRFYKRGPFHMVICGEYYLQGYDEIFASHFSRGSNLVIAKHLKGWKRYYYNIPLFSNYFLKKKRKKEKKRWIKICKEIVNKTD